MVALFDLAIVERQRVAALRGESETDLAARTFANTRAFLGLA